MKRLGRKINESFHTILTPFQRIIGSPLWSLGVIVITVTWMVFERYAPHPIDDPRTGYPLTVLVYTLLSLWVENLVKVSQSQASVVQQQQMDRIEFLVQKVLEVEDRGEQRDIVIHHLISVLERTVQEMLDVIQKDKSK